MYGSELIRGTVLCPVFPLIVISAYCFVPLLLDLNLISSTRKFSSSDGRQEVFSAIERYALSRFEGQYFRKTSHSLWVHKSAGLYLGTSLLLSLFIPIMHFGVFRFL